MDVARGKRWVMHRAESTAWLREHRAESFDALVTDAERTSRASA